MLELAEPLSIERHRILEQIDADPYKSDRTLGITEVIDAHFLIADFFAARGQDFVAVGPASMELLHSALLRQFVALGSKPKWSNPFEIAATVMYGLIKDHPFYDANKRTATVSTLWLMLKHRLGPMATQREIEDFVVDVADDQLPKKYARCREAKNAGDQDAEVRFIARWLNDNSRKIQVSDKKTITYRELRAILRRFGFELENPKDNHIDIIKVEKRRGLFGSNEKRQKIGRIGYPSETRQVAKGDVKRVREICGLTFKKGFVDSVDFYDGVDPMRFLLAEYQDILIRLADR